MKLISRVTNKDVGHLIFTLAEARKRPQSENFLEGFPWLSVIWYKVEELAVPEFENLYLFWDGVAWGNKEELPRRLKQGTKDFMDMVADNIGRPHFGHMQAILEQRDVYRAGPTDDKPFLIVVARDTQGPFMILDGNHRAVAAQWCATESGGQEHIPQYAWMGLSPDMGDYAYYQRVLKADRRSLSS
jgi:hypothetical protein